ncbi:MULTISPECIES: bifunctional 4-hydroxy-2-oxoglutarate aldolase/2-dehydro-3-deoxy-phosphogluconate aldolase [Actinoalloteichus]|uniref:Entner-Doudoroff aldolase n=1 Tax=Actinoalloteichus fjordicus TaxID=1612552 RepID=A0AAC9PTE0_9PSEU|nr:MULTISPECIES: bifunctional 4-hydroxy-2-oxoglutarate aldolase/2-dehydro-3-deoxy-phosphogluconate aldolase [Actinoalloteichus]APU16564.1 Entner-Doudoroff aldolase [Actinoalloteichus fjordicus]APU22631.1 Entner-Doudoroff aldolase [Actinoalloteichus sp. GBA129-24]
MSIDAAAMRVIEADRLLAVVRAPEIPDAAELCAALVAGGIRAVEFTFTTPDVLSHLTVAAEAMEWLGGVVGAGTLRTGDQARQAVDAGARFLVTPGLRRDVADVARQSGTPLLGGAFTPSEVLAALDLDVAAVKIFPAGRLGPKYLADLLGPLPEARLVPSGGVTVETAADYLARGAVAVSAGADVVSPPAVAAGDWSQITDRARALVRAVSP